MAAYWVVGNGGWYDGQSGATSTGLATSSGGSAGGHLIYATDDIYFDSNSPVNADIHLVENGGFTPEVNNITFSGGATAIFRHSSSPALRVYGNASVAGANFVNNNMTLQFVGTGSPILTTGGTAMNVVQQSGTGTLQLGDHLTAAALVAVGGFNAANKNVTSGSFSKNSYGASVTMGNGTWTITGAGAGAFTFDGAATLSAGASTLKFTGANPIFTGGGKTYNNVWNDTSVSLTIVDSNTLNDLKTSASKTTKFTAGTTTTVSTLTSLGGPGTEAVLTSATAATHTLAKSGGGNLSVTLANISYSIASPGGLATASIDGGNNVGWSFGGNSNFLMC